MVRRYLPKNTEELIHWYERYISPLSLVGGFLADNLVLLRRVDLWRSNALLFFYLAVASLSILLLNLIETGKLRGNRWIKVAPFLPVVAQFSFGGLFSGYLSLYSRSAAFSISWIFVLALAGLLLGNERFMRHYVRLPFQIGILFTVLFSFLIFFVPVMIGQIGDAIFVASGLLALLVITAFVRVLGHLMPQLLAENRTRIARSIAVIFLVFNALYFLNAIPPLPLALKDAGVYHGVVREGDTYTLVAEPTKWYDILFRYNTVYHRAPGEAVYVFSAVFAPGNFSTTI